MKSNGRLLSIGPSVHYNVEPKAQCHLNSELTTRTIMTKPECAAPDQAPQFHFILLRKLLELPPRRPWVDALVPRAQSAGTFAVYIFEGTLSTPALSTLVTT